MSQARSRIFDCRRWYLLAVVTMVIGANAFGQYGSLKGTIIDSKTKLPVPFASIFLSSTLFGTRSAEDGTYQLQQIPQGRYDLITSSIGYSLSSVPVIISGGTQLLLISLEPEVKVLKEVDIQSSTKDYLEERKRNIRLFKEYFLGRTYNAKKCKILNIDDLDLDFDKALQILKATSDKPLVIENKALGYKINYLLTEFTLDLRTRHCRISGSPHFEQLVPEKDSQIKRWKKERDRAYYGSMIHFMRSLKYSCLDDDKFVVSELILIKDKIPALGAETVRVNDTLFRSIGIHVSQILHHGTHPLMLLVTYQGEKQEYGYEMTHSANLMYQTSAIKFPNRSSRIYDNGYYESPWSYNMSGYLGWSTKIAEIIPLDYKPWGVQNDLSAPSSEKEEMVEDSPEVAEASPDSASNVVSKNGLNSFSGSVLDASSKTPVAGAVLIIKILAVFPSSLR